jgi:sporulation protein YlmC with PRC-barrel domain
MQKTRLIAALMLAGALSVTGAATAQVAGSTTVGVTVTEATEIARGWSVKYTLLGKTVYNDAGEQLGDVVDLIIAPSRSVSYLIVGAGGFIGIGRHDVAIPVTQIQDLGGKLVMPGASKDVVKSMPRFDYADDTTRRDQLVANAEGDIASARATVGDLQKKASAATSEAKAKLDLQTAALQRDLKAAEAKVNEMKDAGVKRWQEFEADVRAATARLRKSIATATG